MLFICFFRSFLYFDGRHEIASIKPNSALNSNHRTPKKKHTKCVCFHPLPKFRNQQKKHIISALAPPNHPSKCCDSTRTAEFSEYSCSHLLWYPNDKRLWLGEVATYDTKMASLAEVVYNNPP